MAKRPNSHSDMAQARQSDGINVIFDQKSPGSSHSRSRSTSSSASSCSGHSSGSGYYRGRKTQRTRHRSSSSSSTSSTSSSSSSSSSSRSRSRSHPRCHRRSSRCGCNDHRRYGRGRYRCSPPRRYRARSRSYSRSPSVERYSRHSRYYRSRSRSRSSGRWSRYRRHVSQLRCRFSRSPSRTHRVRSRSRSPTTSISLSMQDKRDLLEVAKANAMKILGVENLELPESVKPILSERSESRGLSPEPLTRVRHGSEKSVTQDNEEEPGVSSPRMSPRGKIAFSINNSVAKPTVAAPSSAKVTPRVDSYESRKPYGHWIPVGSGRTSRARRHTKATSP
ncbi:arginine/serine-rich protein 1 [Leuresthes tenuis]|uniref:arginine/serine-rich protein 1 n=1 Tax=Leuresthes tenuis TaxID=355514 RepID=UPI003B512D24